MTHDDLSVIERHRVLGQKKLFQIYVVHSIYRTGYQLEFCNVTLLLQTYSSNRTRRYLSIKLSKSSVIEYMCTYIRTIVYYLANAYL